MAEKEKKAPAKRAKSGAAQRGPDGRFLPGNNANPRGRPSLPPEFKDFAREAPGRLREIADDPATPVKDTASTLTVASHLASRQLSSVRRVPMVGCAGL